jgi:hypothetical protein
MPAVKLSPEATNTFVVKGPSFSLSLVNVNAGIPIIQVLPQSLDQGILCQ